MMGPLTTVREKMRPPDAEAVAAALVERPTQVRYYVLGALASAAMLGYLTRVCLSVANTTIQRDLSLSPERMGDVFSAFSIGYLLFQIPGGWLGGRVGNRIALPLIALFASVATLGMGLAGGLLTLWLARLALGLAQAGLIPCMAKGLRDWFPETQRGTASAVFGSSMSIGAVAASGVTALALPAIGWRWTFAAYAAIGVGWALAFFGWFRNQPSEHPWTNQAERDLIATPPLSVRHSTNPPVEPLTSAAGNLWWNLLISPNVWAVCGQSFFRCFGYIFLVTWFPAYLEKAYGVQVTGAGLLTMIPLAGVVAGTMVGGIVIDRLLHRTGSRRISRSGTATVALLIAAGCILSAAWVRHPLPAVLIIAACMFFAAMGSPASWAATMDISGRHTALVFAVMNMAGVLGDICCAKSLGYLFGYLTEQGGPWEVVLFLFAGIYLLAALCWAGLDPSRSAVGAAVHGDR